jgi:hypothetical protein
MPWVTVGDRRWYEETSVPLDDQRQYYQKHPPKILRYFRYQRIDDERIIGGGHGEIIQKNFVLSCSCGSNSLALSAMFDISEVDESESINQINLFWRFCPACKAPARVTHRMMHIDGDGQPGGADDEDIPNVALECVSCGAVIPPVELLPPGEPRLEECWCDPVQLQCEACGEKRTFLDLAQHGYEGEHGWNKERTLPDLGERKIRIAPHERLVISVYYPDDGFEDGREAFVRGAECDGPRPEDLFTWIRFSKLSAGGVESLMDFECA